METYSSSNAVAQNPEERVQMNITGKSDNPSTPNLKKILMKHWHIIQQKPRLAHIFKQPPIISYRKEKSLKDVLVPAKLPLITPQS